MIHDRTVERIVAEVLRDRPAPESLAALDKVTRRDVERHAASLGVPPEEVLREARTLQAAGAALPPGSAPSPDDPAEIARAARASR